MVWFFLVVMYGCEIDHKEDWGQKNWCFWTVVLEKSLRVPVLQRDQTSQCWRKSSLNFIGRTEAEAKAPILWPPVGKRPLTGKDPDAGKDWRQQEKGMTQDQMDGWYHQLNGYEFEQTPREGEGQGCLKSMGPQRAGHDWATEQHKWLDKAQRTLGQWKYSVWDYNVAYISLYFCTRPLTRWKSPDAGKDWGQEEKGTTEGEMVGQQHQLNGHEFEQAPRLGDGQGSLACCSPWRCKESDKTERLNWTDRMHNT